MRWAPRKIKHFVQPFKYRANKPEDYSPFEERRSSFIGGSSVLPQRGRVTVLQTHSEYKAGKSNLLASAL